MQFFSLALWCCFLLKHLLMEMHWQHSQLQKLPHDFFQHNIPRRWHATIITILVLLSLSQKENLLVRFGYHQKTRCAHVSIAQWAPSDHLVETRLNFVEDLSRWHATISTVLVLLSLSQNENLLVHFGYHQKTRCANVSIAQWAPSDHLMETHLNFVEDLSPLSIVDTSPPKDEDYVSRRSRLIDLIEYRNFLDCKVHKIHTRDAWNVHLEIIFSILGIYVLLAYQLIRKQYITQFFSFKGKKNVNMTNPPFFYGCNKILFTLNVHKPK